MRLHSYVVARDYGFAPNPFHGYCTLATCKPVIRKTADIGDWIVGTGSRKYGRQDHLVFAMRVSCTLTYDEYWNDPSFIPKKPNLESSWKYAYGDNIYHHDKCMNKWIQEDSHHSLDDGKLNKENLQHDTSSTDRVLISNHFFYWGGSGPLIPSTFLGSNGPDIRCHGRGHRNKFWQSFINDFIRWIESNYTANQCFGRPLNWD